MIALQNTCESGGTRTWRWQHATAFTRRMGGPTTMVD
jgi:hypothetical protein